MAEDLNQYANNVSSLSNQINEKVNKAKSNIDKAKQQKQVADIAESVVKLTKTAGQSISNVSKSVLNASKTAIEASKNAVSGFTDAVSQDINVNKQNLVAMSLSRASPLFGYFASKFMETGVFKDFADKIKSKLGEAVSSVASKFKTGVSSIWEKGKQGLTSVYEKATNIISKEKEEPKKPKPKSMDEAKVDLDKLKKKGLEIPQMQKGGVVKEQGLAEVHAAEVVAPINKILKSMEKVAKPSKDKVQSLVDYSRESAKLVKRYNDTLVNMKKRVTIMEEDTQKSRNIFKTFFKNLIDEIKPKKREESKEEKIYRAITDIRSSLYTAKNEGIITALSNAWRRTLFEHPGLRALIGMSKAFAAVPLWIARGIFQRRGNYESHIRYFTRGSSPQQQTASILSLLYPAMMYRLDDILSATRGEDQERDGWSIAGLVKDATVGVSKSIGRTVRESFLEAREGYRNAVAAGTSGWMQGLEAGIGAISGGGKQAVKETGLPELSRGISEKVKDISDIFTAEGRERRAEKKRKEELEQMQLEERRRFGSTPELLRELSRKTNPISTFYEEYSSLFVDSLQANHKAVEQNRQVIEMQKVGQEYQAKMLKYNKQQSENTADTAGALKTQRLMQLFMFGFNLVKGAINTVVNAIDALASVITGGAGVVTGAGTTAAVLKGAGKLGTLGRFAKGVGKKAGPVGLAITTLDAFWEGSKGWSESAKIFDKKDKEEAASLGEKVSSYLGGMLHSLSLGTTSTEYYAKTIKGSWDKYWKWSGDVADKTSKLFSDIGASIKGKADDSAKAIEGAWDRYWKWSGDAADKTKETFSDIGASIKDKAADIKNKAGDVKDSVAEKYNEAKDKTKETFMNIGSRVKDKAIDIKNKAGDVKESISEKYNEAKDKTKETFMNIGSSVKDFAGGLWNKAKSIFDKEGIEKKDSIISERFKGIASSIGSGISDFAGGLWGKAKSVFDREGDKEKSEISKKFKGIASSIGSKVKDFAGGIWGKVKSVFDKEEKKERSGVNEPKQKPIEERIPDNIKQYYAKESQKKETRRFTSGSITGGAPKGEDRSPEERQAGEKMTPDFIAKSQLMKEAATSKEFQKLNEENRKKMLDGINEATNQMATNFQTVNNNMVITLSKNLASMMQSGNLQGSGEGGAVSRQDIVRILQGDLQ